MNQTQYAILGMLSLKPMSAYDMRKFSKQSIGFFWNESYGNLHKNIQTLNEEGYIQIESQLHDQRKTIVYEITKLGLTTLNDWLTVKPKDTVFKSEMLFKIFFASKQTHQELLKHLEAQRQQYLEVIPVFDHIAQTIPASNERSEQWLLTLDFGKRYSQLIIDWITSVLERETP